MIPVVKGWCTETAIELCSTALQVFGGMGYIEETGIAQQYRDVRIITIYEGTTGIQALDLVGRKLIRDMGATATKIGSRRWRPSRKSAPAHADPDGQAHRRSAGQGAQRAQRGLEWIGMNAMGDLNKAFACSVPYLQTLGNRRGRLADGARRADRRGQDRRGRSGERVLSRQARDRGFYATHVLIAVRRGYSTRSSRARPT